MGQGIKAHSKYEKSMLSYNSSWKNIYCNYFPMFSVTPLGAKYSFSE
jgi:hypothetical protein